jgi:hypothetical protein
MGLRRLPVLAMFGMLATALDLLLVPKELRAR